MIGIQGRLTGPGNQPLSGFRAYRVRFFNAATSGGRLAFFNGSYPEPATLTKKLRIDTLVNPTNLGF